MKRWLIIGLVAIAAAVAISLLTRGPAVAALPTYDLSPAELHVARGDAPFDILLRPDRATTTKVIAYVFGIGEGEPDAIDAKVEITPGGAVRLTGRTRALAGAGELRIVIGTAPAPIARFEDALVRARDGTSDDAVRVLRVPITRE